MGFLSQLKQDVAAALHSPSAAPTTGAPPVVSQPGTLHQIPVRRADPADSVGHMDIGGGSAPFDSPEITTATPISPTHNRARTAPTHPDRDSFLQCLATDVVSSFNGGDAVGSALQSSKSSVHSPLADDEFTHCLKDKYFSQGVPDSELVQFYANNLYEYERGKSVPIVKGRLRAHVKFWENICAPDWVINTITNGYVIPFDSLPTSAQLHNNHSAMDNNVFVSQAISDLLKLGLIVECPQPPTVINPLSVSFNAKGTPRLILDLRHVNKHIPKPKFRMDDWKVFANYFVPDGFLFKFDMKSGYHHVDIWPDHQQFLGFQWPLNSTKMRYFCFTVLPFGLSSAPYLFTKLFRPLVAHWRALGFRIVLFLDDGAGCEHTYAAACSVSASVRQDLISAGVVPNVEKSVWDPTQILEWLGLIWNFAEGYIAISHSRITNFTTALQKFSDNLPFVSPRFIASIVGKIISMSPVIGNVTLIMSRFLQSAVALSDHWDFVIDLSKFQYYQQCLTEVKFWSSNIVSLNNRNLLRHHAPTAIFYSMLVLTHVVVMYSL